MKKIALLALLAGSIMTANAQLVLSGASPYTQNFDGLGNVDKSIHLPTGWSTYFAATPTSLGTFYHDSTYWYGVSSYVGHYNIYVDSLCDTYIFGHGFYSYASADVAGPGDTCSVQDAYTNRALGVRPSSTFDQPSFNLYLAGTEGMSSVGVSFKLQNLDTSCGRSHTFSVQYGLGATPTTFVDGTVTGYTTVGGYDHWTDTAISVTFDAGIDNQSQPVWIRIVALDTSAGKGYRNVTAIDDFSLTWTGMATAGVKNVNAVSANLALNVLGTATSSAINLGYNAPVAGNYALSVYDLTGRVVYQNNVYSNDGTQQYTITGMNIPAGLYIVKMTNGVSTGIAKVSVQ
jgi:Secretion system C-terminal sorting domain